MKRAAFLQKMHELDGGLRVNVRRMPEWFEKTLRVLEALGEQKGGVDHPGHRGTARENPLQQLFDQMLPATLSVEKGFAVNQFMAQSREQDLLVVDRNISGLIVSRRKLFPDRIVPGFDSGEVESHQSDDPGCDGQLREYKAVVRVAAGRAGTERRRLRCAMLRRVLLRKWQETRSAGGSRQ